MTTEQLARIGDLSTPIALLTNGASASASNSKPNPLSRLQNAALAFADHSTAHVSVSTSVFEELRSAFSSEGAEDQALNQKMVEAAATVAAYNMVSRFLVSLDVDDKSNTPCPVPAAEGEVAAPRVAANKPDGTFPHPTSAAPSTAAAALYYAPDAGYLRSGSVPGGLTLATRVHFHSYGAPWILLINSLMTNLSMWDWVLPTLKARGFNILTYDQAGHGLSSVPDDSDKGCTVQSLADDAAMVVSALGLPSPSTGAGQGKKPLHAVIGVSQGGATALCFGLRHGALVERVIACDTQPSTPAANVGAWDERIALARKEGSMRGLAKVTVARWFEEGKSAADVSVRRKITGLIEATQVEGFVAGARALQSYDLLADGLVGKSKEQDLDTLLVAGAHDGVIPKALRTLAENMQKDGAKARFEEVADAGHLPMCDNPEAFLEKILPFLEGK